MILWFGDCKIDYQVVMLYIHIYIYIYIYTHTHTHRDADKSLARPTFRCILFDGEKISFDASFVMYINSPNISPIMIINRIYEYQKFLPL